MNNENLVTDANHSGTELFALIDALSLDEESATYLANVKKLYAIATDEEKVSLEKTLAIRFLKN